MNPAMALEHQRFGPANIGEPLTLLGLPSKRSSQEVSGSTEELFKGITNVLDSLLLRVIDSRTKAEFVEARAAVFSDYFRMVIALSNLVRVVVPAHAIERLLGESFSELEATFRDEGLERFGTLARDQAMFTIWTLRKTSRLASQIAGKGPVDTDAKERDSKLASEFAFYAGWAQFHLDCLRASIRFDKAVTPEILEETCDGLRAVVNAYGLIRQGVDLRLARDEEFKVERYAWDEEDQELLDSSMRDMDSAILDGNVSWNHAEPTVATIANPRAATATIVEVPSPTSVRIRNEAAPRHSPIFGTHIREGIEIVKDWIESRKNP